MADPVTSNILLAVPLHGSDVDTWDQPLNADFTAIDGFIGGVQAISVSNAPVTLTSPSGSATPSGGPTQAQNAVLRFAGVLTAGVQVTLPLPGVYVAENLTTGAFVLSFRATGSGEVIGIEQGSSHRIYCDGTNVRFVGLPSIGSYLDLCDAVVPAWITACTIPPYLNCDGTTFNATTYPYLNSKLGGNTLPDLRGGVRATLNQGTTRITTAGSSIDGDTRFSIGGNQLRFLLQPQLPNITLPVYGTVTGLSTALYASAPSILHATGIGLGNSAFDLFFANTASVSGVTSVATVNGSAGNSLSTNLNGAVAQTSLSVMPPTTISGITLIRAA